MLSEKRVLVVAAHPDDEVLGCGATVKRLSSAGADVKVLILGEGATSRGDRRDADTMKHELKTLRANAAKASEIIGASEVMFGGLPDNRFDGLELLDVIKIIEKVKKSFNPTLVLTQHAGDLNIDHTITNRATLTAFRPLPGESVVSVYAYEVLSSTEYSHISSGHFFSPDTYVDTEGFTDAKIEALSAYESEFQPDPYPRSREAIIHLASMRGRQAGLRSAEAFMLLRNIIRI